MPDPHTTTRWHAAASLACIFLGPLPVGSAQALEQAGATAGFVNDRECASCHRAIYRSYRQVGMAKSFYPPRRENIIEDFERNHFFHAPSQRHYEMTQQDGTYVFRRYQLDEHGRRVNEWERPIDWIIGSGNHSRGYLYQTELGELYELPIVWYTQTQRWGMAPGYDEPHHEGITRPITRECMFCHNAYPPTPPTPAAPAAPAGSDAYGQLQLFPRELPTGTGCQRCHGPGGEHVRLANNLDAPLDDVIAAIVNPARLPPARRDDVCFQCHLQPTSKLTSFVRRFGRTDYSYRPGQPLADYLVHLDFDEGRERSQRFEINHHPYRLRQSRCYLQSNGELNCMTCHDPHRKVPAAERASHYRDRCLTCHATDDCRLDAMRAKRAEAPQLLADVPADDCVTCHMPARRTEDVVHVVMTDHLITRRPSGDPLAALRETPPAEGATAELYFPGRGPPEPQRRIYQAISAVRDGNLGEIESLQAAIAAHPPAAVEPYFELGAAQLRAGQPDKAAATFADIIRRHPTFAPAHSNLGVALAALGRTEAAVEHLNRAIELEPSSPDAHYNLAAALARLGRSDEAKANYEKAIDLRPNYASAHFNLANALARAGRFEQAAAGFRTVLAIDPSVSSASENLGAALRHLGDWPQAVAVWRHGAALDPGHTGLAMELALAYLAAPTTAVRDAEKGLEFAERAARLDPHRADPALAVGLGLVASNRPTEALRAAREARRLGGDPVCCLLLSAIALDQLGERAAAQRTYDGARTVGGRPSDTHRIRHLLRAAAAKVFDERP